MPQFAHCSPSAPPAAILKENHKVWFAAAALICFQLITTGRRVRAGSRETCSRAERYRTNYRLFKQELYGSSRPLGCGDFENVCELLDVTTLQRLTAEMQ